ncbi:MAG: alcohol dehydrogenase catalytic domain-containing protein [Saprospiraceae bacterium]
MKALTLHAPQKIHFESVPDPEILAPTDVIVQVSEAAICGSDLHVYFGREAGLDAGTVMGHEFTGFVVAAGHSVRTLRTGMRVISPFTTSCGQCYYCRIGLTARCTQGQLFGWVAQGKGLQGGQSELVRVPLAETTLVPVPESLGSQTSLLLGDILATGYHGALPLNGAAIRRVGVIGFGPVGMMAWQVLLRMGFDQVVVFEPDFSRRNYAREMGAEVRDPQDTESLTVWLDQMPGGGLDGVVEAVGGAGPQQLAFRVVRAGGLISSVGVHTQPHFSFSPAAAYDKNITYRSGRCSARHYIPDLLQWLDRGWDVISPFTDTFDLREGAAAYERFANRTPGCMKVLLKP